MGEEGEAGKGGDVLGEGGQRRTYHVKLRAEVGTRAVQSDELATEEVLTGRNAFGDRNRLRPAIRNQPIHTPLAAVKGVFVDLWGEKLASVSTDLFCRDARGLLLPRSSSRICFSSKETNRTYLKPPTTNPTIRLRITDFLHIRHHGPLVARVDDIIRARGEGVAPVEFRACARGEGDDG
jgi:hypothetical protein